MKGMDVTAVEEGQIDLINLEWGGREIDLRIVVVTEVEVMIERDESMSGLRGVDCEIYIRIQTLVKDKISRQIESRTLGTVEDEVGMMTAEEGVGVRAGIRITVTEVGTIVRPARGQGMIGLVMDVVTGMIMLAPFLKVKAPL
jgi:hypothetical protein